MSNGPKKPPRDLSDLKARLGMLNKNVGRPPAPTPSGSQTAPGAPPRDTNPGTGPMALEEGAELGMDTAVVRIDAAEPDTNPGVTAQPAIPQSLRSVPPAPAAPAAVPQPVSATPAPGAGFSPFGIGSASELFKQPEPEPEPSAADLAAQFETPGAPHYPAEPPPPEAEFAHPLHVGDFSNASARVDLSAMEEAALADFEDSARSNRKVVLTAVAVASVLTLIFGFAIGNSMVTRKLINLQIAQAKQVNEYMTPNLDQADLVIRLIAGLNSRRVEWDKVKALPETLGGINAGSVLSADPPLPAELTQSLANGVANINALFRATVEHRRRTLQADKAKLEDLEKGDKWKGASPIFAALFAPVDPKTEAKDWIPSKGTIVAVTGKPLPRDDPKAFLRLPIRFRSGKEKAVNVNRLVLLDAKEIFQGDERAVLDAYSKRTEELRQMAKELHTYLPSLRQKLQDEAARQTVFAF